MGFWGDSVWCVQSSAVVSTYRKYFISLKSVSGSVFSSCLLQIFASRKQVAHSFFRGCYFSLNRGTYLPQCPLFSLLNFRGREWLEPGPHVMEVSISGKLAPFQGRIIYQQTKHQLLPTRPLIALKIIPLPPS